ncbi:uncharacterized protein LAESUDRAFT_101484 [Laetiporus sulphureus 93-53]|uniref:Uncharacterized protein n=1 Tax=Laetiporus sulphureus 93-53 TaxID=1314785 RepID=A0A165ESR9_9APHY|nr:uncharacterized protein LAESUDRAFT_101484 [Laetiporus sulphureus 93-53]KZT07681.1 hypothetical protein LAESUDRAFT_101484 [Laetiporus sulphureus 93-53]
MSSTRTMLHQHSGYDHDGARSSPSSLPIPIVRSASESALSYRPRLRFGITDALEESLLTPVTHRQRPALAEISHQTTNRGRVARDAVPREPFPGAPMNESLLSSGHIFSRPETRSLPTRRLSRSSSATRSTGRESRLTESHRRHRSQSRSRSRSRTKGDDAVSSLSLLKPGQWFYTTEGLTRGDLSPSKSSYSVAETVLPRPQTPTPEAKRPRFQSGIPHISTLSTTSEKDDISEIIYRSPARLPLDEIPRPTTPRPSLSVFGEHGDHTGRASSSSLAALSTTAQADAEDLPGSMYHIHNVSHPSQTAGELVIAQSRTSSSIITPSPLPRNSSPFKFFVDDDIDLDEDEWSAGMSGPPRIPTLSVRAKELVMPRSPDIPPIGSGRKVRKGPKGGRPEGSGSTSQKEGSPTPPEQEYHRPVSVYVPSPLNPTRQLPDPLPSPVKARYSSYDRPAIVPRNRLDCNEGICGPCWQCLHTSPVWHVWMNNYIRSRRWSEPSGTAPTF